MILRNPAILRDSFLRVIWTGVIFCLSVHIISSQGIIGTVLEEFSRYAVRGAEIQLLSGDSLLLKARSNVLGQYKLKTNKAGSVEIRIEVAGYKSLLVQDVILDGYTTLRLEHLLEKLAFDLPSVTIIESRKEPANFIRTITPDDLILVAGNFDDPVRIAHSEPGIVLLNDQANHLSARGQSPLFNSWYLEGLEIVNPSHTNNAGTFSDLPTQYGGGVNMFSAQILGSTNLYMGVNPVEIGHTSGAVVNMHLHESAVPEWRAKAGLLGFELGGGANLGKESILDVNLRYSFTGLLANLGVDFGGEKIGFYDGVVSFRNSGLKHELKLFAWAGRSVNEFEHVEPPEDREKEKDFFDIDYGNDILGAGGRYDLNLSQKVSLRSGIAYSTNPSTYKKTSHFSSNPLTFDTDQTISITSIFTECSINHSSYIHSVGGIDFTNWTHRDDDEPSEPLTEESTIRPYINTSIKLSPTWEIEIGGDLQHTFYNEEWIPGYRGQLNWIASGYNTLFAGIRHSPNKPFYIGRGFTPYVHLKSNTYEIGWKYAGKTNRLGLNMYYQEMKRLQAYYLGSDPDDALEYLADYPNSSFAGILGNNRRGVSRHVGIEGQWGYSNENGWGFNLNQSVYKSVRGLEDSSLEPGRYNGQFATHLSVSKEIVKESNGKNKIWNIALRGIFNGGLWEPEINTSAFPIEYKYPINYDQHLPAYKRIDAGITRTIAYSKVRWRYSLDIQNLFGFTNIAYHYNDTFLDEVVAQEQLGIIPVLSIQASW